MDIGGSATEGVTAAHCPSARGHAASGPMPCPLHPRLLWGGIISMPVRWHCQRSHTIARVRSVNPQIAEVRWPQSPPPPQPPPPQPPSPPPSLPPSPLSE